MSNFQQPFPNNQYPPQPPAMGQQHYNQQYQQQNVQPNMQQGNFPQFNQGQGGPNTGFSIPNVSPEMLNMGFSAGQDMLNKQREKWMPGVSSFWLSLKYYFAVNKTYVLRKMKILGYPLLSTHWNRLSIDDSTPNPSSSDIPLHKYALPRDDVNATDLYIPTMSFVTYCILVCYIRGVFGDEDTNIPDILIQTVWKCCMLQVCESLFMSLGFSLMGVSSIPFLDIIAYTGYKYFGLCINTLSWVLGGTIYFIVTIYTAGMLGYFILKSLAAVVPREVNGPFPRHIMLLLFAAVQFLISLLLSSY